MVECPKAHDSLEFCALHGEGLQAQSSVKIAAATSAEDRTEKGPLSASSPRRVGLRLHQKMPQFSRQPLMRVLHSTCLDKYNSSHWKQSNNPFHMLLVNWEACECIRLLIQCDEHRKEVGQSKDLFFMSLPINLSVIMKDWPSVLCVSDFGG